MPDLKYRIIASKNGWQKEFYFFKQVPKGDIYHGRIVSHSKEKTSVHASGVIHIKDGQQVIQLGQLKPLAEFEGFRQLFGMEIGNLVFESAGFGKVYTGKYLTDELIIDLHEFNHQIGIMAFLIEPDQEKQLDALAARNQNIYYKIFKEAKPWIAIIVYDSFPDKNKLKNP